MRATEVERVFRGFAGRCVHGLRAALLGIVVSAATGCDDGSDNPEAEHDHPGRDHDAQVPVPANDAGPVPDSSVAGGFEWHLPASFPRPVVPTDNPMSDAKVELGRHLFYDKRLSGNQTQSCATCHQQSKAFTDGRAQGLGSTGELHSRSSMSLANVAYASTLTWANPLMLELERQVQVPELGDAPVELGLSSLAQIAERLTGVPLYAQLFATAYPDEDAPITTQNANRAIAAFQRTLFSGRAPFDRWLVDGDEAAISESAQRGYELFNSEQLECFHCHGGFNFSDQTNWDGKATFDMPFHNTGLFNIDGAGAYPEPNTGIHDVTGDAADMGKFKAPTLRNIAVTAPYMHDGSIATLSEVLDHYSAGGRTLSSGPNQGNGNTSPLKDPMVRSFTLDAGQRADVIAFLESLTDEEFLTDPAFADPFADETP